VSAPIYVRCSETLRALVDEAGVFSDAVRALLLLGAAVAALPAAQTPAARAEAGALLGRRLRPSVRDALERLYFGAGSDSAHASDADSWGDSWGDSAPSTDPYDDVAMQL
jgi:hypothetical protein